MNNITSISSTEVQTNHSNIFYVYSEKFYEPTDIIKCANITNEKYNNFAYTIKNPYPMTRYVHHKNHGYIFTVYVKNDTNVKIVNNKWIYGDCVVIYSHKLQDVYIYPKQFPIYIKEFIAKYFGDVFKYIKNKTFDICKMFLIYDTHLLRHVDNQTQELCDFVLDLDPFAIIYVNKKLKCEEMFRKVLARRGEKMICVIPQKYIEKYMCDALIDTCPDMISAIPKNFLTDEICMKSISHNIKNFVKLHKSMQKPEFIEYVKNHENFYKTPELIKCDFYTEDMIIDFLDKYNPQEKYPRYHSYMNCFPLHKLTEKVCKKIIDKKYIRFVDFPTKVKASEILLYALQNYTWSLSNCILVFNSFFGYPQDYQNILTQEIVNIIIEKTKHEPNVYQWIMDNIPETFITDEMKKSFVVPVEEDVKNIRKTKQLWDCQNPLSISRELCLEIYESDAIEKHRIQCGFEYVSDEILVDIVDLYKASYQYIKNKTPEITNKVIKIFPENLRYVPENIITQDMCDQVIDYMFENNVRCFIPEKFRTKKYYDSVMKICNDNKSRYGYHGFGQGDMWDLFNEMPDEYKEKYFDMYVRLYHGYN